MTLCSKVAFGDRSKSLSLATPDSDGGRDMESAHFPSIITTFLTEPSLKPTKTPWDPWAAAHKQRGTPKKRVLLDGWMTSTESTSGSFRLQKDTEPSQLLLIIISPDKINPVTAALWAQLAQPPSMKLMSGWVLYPQEPGNLLFQACNRPLKSPATSSSPPSSKWSKLIGEGTCDPAKYSP